MLGQLSKWLKSLREYMKHVGGWIELDNEYIPTAERVHDGYIMDMILTSQQFNDKEIRQLNYCRLFLQAVTLSDITQANGRMLDPNMLQGVPDIYSSTSRWHHVTQEKPLPKLWKLWQRANRLWSNEHGELHQPLQRWQHKLQRQRRASVARLRRYQRSNLRQNHIIERHQGRGIHEDPTGCAAKRLHIL